MNKFILNRVLKILFVVPGDDSVKFGGSLGKMRGIKVFTATDSIYLEAGRKIREGARAKRKYPIMRNTKLNFPCLREGEFSRELEKRKNGSEKDRIDYYLSFQTNPPDEHTPSSFDLARNMLKFAREEAMLFDEMGLGMKYFIVNVVPAYNVSALASYFRLTDSIEDIGGAPKPFDPVELTLDSAFAYPEFKYRNIEYPMRKN